MEKVRRAVSERSKEAAPDDLVKLALRVLNVDGSYRNAASLLRAATGRDEQSSTTYVEQVASSLLDVDPYLVAALRLECYILPCSPDFAWLRLAKEQARHSHGFEGDESEAHGRLLEAIEKTDVDALRHVLIRGQKIAVFRCTATGKTPLHFLAEMPPSEDVMRCAELLLSCGADTNARDSTLRTPLHAAAASLNSELVELLLAQTPDAVDGRDHLKMTPLHVVASTLFKRPFSSLESTSACSIAKV